jgi:redox-sensitive bicupin YhaK (pirin superfamily)
MSTGAVVRVSPLGFPWETADPFLFCVYHDDAYPRANPDMGPAATLAGRDIGQDFSRRDGWSMYHGEKVPGFPAHPHRGFETVTIVRKGLVDHADSLGAAARYGQGDVQWLTTGKGVVHSEMFPLLEDARSNPLELFQIWLNLPARSKMSAPHFTMFWSQDIPRRVVRDAAGRVTEIAVIAGALSVDGEAVRALAPPPDSWAAGQDSDIAIWTLRMAPGAAWLMPEARSGTGRHLYLFKGGPVTVDGREIGGPSNVELRPDVAVPLVNGAAESEFLLLQGRPIDEPVAQHGPFVMNTREELVQAFADFQRTRFGGWPWGDPAPVHGRDPARFAKHPDGRLDRPR